MPQSVLPAAQLVSLAGWMALGFTARPGLGFRWRMFCRALRSDPGPGRCRPFGKGGAGTFPRRSGGVAMRAFSLNSAVMPVT